ncbi:hypothetical protein [Aggregatilinea lenta]|uniref:hypothetical protein n=1 Tax=Aggregatilinea lenta TaxID=913108 RepID=UPI0013C36FE7|nr:hypothetical protein [Aggregatilinea lenta]
MAAQTIMVVVEERMWTAEALHAACVLAREMQAGIALVALIPAQRLSWLGTDLPYRQLSSQFQCDLRDYTQIAEGYGVPVALYEMQYSDFMPAIVEAAGAVGAQTVCVHLPPSLIPRWSALQARLLRRRLAQMGCALVEQFPFPQDLACRPDRSASDSPARSLAAHH